MAPYSPKLVLIQANLSWLQNLTDCGISLRGYPSLSGPVFFAILGLCELYSTVKLFFLAAIHLPWLRSETFCAARVCKELFQ